MTADEARPLLQDRVAAIGLTPSDEDWEPLGELWTLYRQYIDEFETELANHAVPPWGTWTQRVRGPAR